MEHQKIMNLFSEATESKFVARKWNSVNDNSNVLKSNLCDYNDDYILVKGNITVTAAPETQVAFKKYALFTKYITKVDATTKDDAENLNLAMPMFNLIEYSSNYSETTGRLWFYSKDEASHFNADIGNTDDFKSFKCKAKLLRNTAADGANGILKNATVCCTIKIFK